MLDTRVRHHHLHPIRLVRTRIQSNMMIVVVPSMSKRVVLDELELVRSIHLRVSLCMVLGIVPVFIYLVCVCVWVCVCVCVCVCRCVCEDGSKRERERQTDRQTHTHRAQNKINKYRKMITRFRQRCQHNLQSHIRLIT